MVARRQAGDRLLGRDEAVLENKRLGYERKYSA
jgi:hypothetical protein